MINTANFSLDQSLPRSDVVNSFLVCLLSSKLFIRNLEIIEAYKAKYPKIILDELNPLIAVIKTYLDNYYTNLAE